MARREHQLVKAGFTLVELLVYIAIVGIVVIVAGQAFSNSTKMRVRTQSMLKASEVAENVATWPPCSRQTLRRPEQRARWKAARLKVAITLVP